MSDVLTGLAFFMIIEGLAYALAPSALKRMASLLPKMSDDQLRLSGVTAIALGTALVWLIRG